ncbi:MAG: hypothetical protein P5702_25205 [Limnospira sp. PMC 1291.21]|uniref:hypothetical protein n=1 Tax=unclassified Limnospira TaxID=2642885 RepID=UPI0028E1832C|nr:MULTISPECIES: hypothetical protein [unclassified Limnospira]MDT9180831.1 hypothetical protein [Limnospira sp. PMC 1238.20]MDT9196163.1 hypothetical protein [Limnospira sp. PMC 1245.20]MDT9206426.1 hypothetical protein [Limnospira sp. PMC 1243.20]MDT9211562.1 hypothetical protein [Limnospira sp. PMC 1252.20]MDT9216645.1 hypothetical protein [Limnospira sp. PMC 1256.20]
MQFSQAVERSPRDFPGAIAYLSRLGGGTKPNTTISLPVGFHPSNKERSLFPSYLSLLGFTQATNVGFHPSHKGRSLI